MNAEREKKIPAAPTGRKYSSVGELVAGEMLSPETRDKFADLQADTALARALVEMRQSAGLTQEKIGEMLSKTQSAISKLESSVDSELTVGDLLDYSKATNERFTLVIGKPMNHVQWVKHHAFGIKEHLSALAQMAHQDGDLEQAIKGFFGEAFFNILDILSECQNEMPNSKDVQVRIRSVGTKPRRHCEGPNEAVMA